MSASNWLLLDSGLGGAAWNMAVDAALLATAARLGKPVLRFYGWTEAAATFGYFQKITEIEAATSLRPLIRRPTGGGLVPHDADWTYSLVVPPDHEWHALAATESYARMHRWIADALGKLGVPAELAPACRRGTPGQCFAGYERSDLLISGRKIAGAAQRRNRDGLLIQGSLQPSPRGLSRATWQEAMCAVAGRDWGVNWSRWQLSDWLIQLARAQESERFSRDTYNRHR